MRTAEMVYRKVQPAASAASRPPSPMPHPASRATDGRALEMLGDRVHGPRPAQQEPVRTGYEDLIAASRGIGPQGAALEAGTRGTMEEHFGADLGGVRVHTGPHAASAASALHARAYSVGEDIVLAAGQRPSLEEPHRNVLAHELAHVVQQRAGGDAAGVESRAQAAAAAVSSGGAREPRGGLGGAPVGLYRQDVNEPLVSPPKKPSFELGVGDLSLNAATLDGFVTDSAALIPPHQQKLDDAAKLIKALIASGGWIINVNGHTDAVGAEAHNEALGQQRADSVAKGLEARGIERWRIWTSSKGETELVVKTEVANGKNRRVEIRLKPLPVPPSLPPPGASSKPLPDINLTLPPTWKPPGGTPDFRRPGTIPTIPTPDQDWLKNALENDKLLRELPPALRDKAIDALKTADEAAADKILDLLPTDDKTKTAVKAAVKALLQLLKGKKWTPPVPPPPQYEQPPSSAPKLEPPPGVIQLPPIRF